jgi:hypothetical protein
MVLLSRKNNFVVFKLRSTFSVRKQKNSVKTKYEGMEGQVASNLACSILVMLIACHV